MEANKKEVILCDEQGNQLGTYDKLQAHIDNKLHRAFSILLFNDAGDMLVQKRADTKYHTPGLWANACCSHNIVDEDVVTSAKRRLTEELGFTCELEEQFDFLYEAQLADNLWEHEYDTVLKGIYNGPTNNLNPEEVSEVRWMSKEQIQEETTSHPEKFAPWFLIILKEIDFIS